MSDNLRRGIIFAFATSIISGVSIFVNKYAVAAIQPPLFFTSIKNALVGLMLIALIIALRKWRQIRTLHRDDVLLLILVALTGGALPFALYFTGLSQVPAINAAIIHKSLIIWVAILAVPYLRERFSLLGVISILLLFAGNISLGGFTGFTLARGEWMILAATLLWALEQVIAKRALTRVDPDIVASFRMGLGSLILVVATWLIAPKSYGTIPSFDSMQWVWLIVTSLMLAGYVMTWYRALAYAPAITVSSVLVSSTIVTNILSGIFVTHSFAPGTLIQITVILAGVLLAYLTARRVIMPAIEQG